MHTSTATPFSRRRKRIDGFFRFFAFTIIFSLPVMAGAAPDLPAGFIALSESPMTWRDAVAYCQQQGGKLPRINNSDSWAGRSEANIDGFGTVGARWPTGLPFDIYWTGTALSDNPSQPWMAGVQCDSDVDAIFYDTDHGSTNRTACVP